MEFKSYSITEEQKEKFRAKVLDKESWRHHYIPQFLIDGFVNDENKVYVFDKVLGKILPKTYPTKSVFFEPERNTIEVGGQPTTYLEGVFYKIIDNADSKVVSYLRDNDLKKIELSHYLKTQFFFFVLNLFWRNPVNDELFDLVYSHFTVDNLMFKEESFKKMFKPIMPGYIGEDIVKMNIPQREVNISEYPSDIYLISDYPILFRTIPNSFPEFGTTDFLMPINSRRMYHSTEKLKDDFNEEMAQHYNLQAIHQAKQYVASGDKVLLEKNIDLYKKFVNDIPKWKEHAFLNHNYKTV